MQQELGNCKRFLHQEELFKIRTPLPRKHFSIRKVPAFLAKPIEGFQMDARQGFDNHFHLP